ncbi:MAG TPA: tryptophan synthase subunit alpha [Sphingomicrobium sp.]|nr:tryptophan synthase subunit alpha [Sphingomicrobium sp.]
MSRYAAMFDRLGERGEGAFGAFLMLGDPDLPTSAALLDAMVAGGADMVEVGIPFSDPVADGPVIQSAAKRALDAGVRVADCFELIAGFRERNPAVPLGILTYANIVVAHGGFAAEVAAAGADSLLIADVPTIEAEPFVREMDQAGVDPVLIAAPNTPDAALVRIASLSKAYTYCASRSGTTGTHQGGQFDRGLVERLLRFGAPPPIFGFGISNPEHVRAALDSGAAGVICGSAIVDLAARGGDVINLVGLLKAATLNDKARERLMGATIESP